MAFIERFYGKTMKIPFYLLFLVKIMRGFFFFGRICFISKSGEILGQLATNGSYTVIRHPNFYFKLKRTVIPQNVIANNKLTLCF